MTRASLSNAAARAIFLDRHGLMAPPSGPGKGANLAGVIHDLGFAQVDSVNTLARAHDMILWSRRQQYRPANLAPLMADRLVFEHWTHDAAVLPMAFFPHWRLKFARDQAHMDRRWDTWQREGYREKFAQVLERIAAHGPVTSRDVGEGEAKGSTGWWDWHPSKTALEYLWRSGELSITRREGFRKVYDLTENVVPPEYLNARPSPEDTVDWAMGAALDRLGFATPGELRAFFDILTVEEARAWAARALEAGIVKEIDVEMADGKWRRSLARPELTELTPPMPGNRVRVLSPFDPALRDRARALRLFGFHYRIEIFVPAPRRRFGYYVFPVLEGDRLIGRIDMKRTGGGLVVTAFWPEAGAALGKGREIRLCAELARVARLGGCADVRFCEGWRR